MDFVFLILSNRFCFYLFQSPSFALCQQKKKKKKKKKKPKENYNTFCKFYSLYKVWFLIEIRVTARTLQDSSGGCPRGVMVKAMDCGIVVSEFVLQSCYYVHFKQMHLGKYEPPYPPSYGLNSTTPVLLGEWLWH